MECAGGYSWSHQYMIGGTMKHLSARLRGLSLSLLALACMLAALPSSSASASGIAQAASATDCGLSQVAFCETFDAPAGIGNRSGQMNGTLWGVSRVSGDQNLGVPDR